MTFPIPFSTIEGIAWPALPPPQAARLLALQQQFERSQTLPAAELRIRQFAQLQLLLTHADRFVPFYAGKLRQAGFTPGEPITAALWEKLPILDRKGIQDAGATLHSSAPPAAHGTVATDSTSGSTGAPVTIRRTELAQLLWYGFTLREEMWHRRDLAGKLAAIRLDYHRKGTVSQPHELRFKDWGPPLATVYPTGPGAMLDIRCTIAEQVEWLRREEPDYLLSFPSNLLFLARHCREHGVRLPSLRGVRGSGEVVSPEVRAACREVWGVEIVSMYSAVETGYIALQCPLQPHYHVQAEGVLVEIIDADGRPCRPGEIGRVVVTPLHNYAMPLIRYAIGDYAELGESCPCGRTLPVLRRILGRTRDMLTLPSGEKRFSYHGPRAFAEIGALVQYQIVQKSLEDIEVRLVARRALTADEEERMRRSVLAGLGHDFRLGFTYCDEIPRTAGGKYQDFRSELAGSSAAP